MNNEEELSTKKRILDAAAAEFAERGYDGARVDGIAKRAAVNKALIYYYYKNKEDLLALLLRETVEAVFSVFEHGAFASIDFAKPETFGAFIRAALDVLEPRQDVVRVMLMESMKRSPVNGHIFHLIREALSRMFAVARSLEAHIPEDDGDVMVMEFFTGIMPILSYVVYHEAWMERFGVPEEVLRERFIVAFLGTHGAYSFAAYRYPGKE